MAYEMGIGVRQERLPAGVSGKIVRDRAYSGGFRIAIAIGDPPQRKRFTLAHEIAHFVLHRDMIGDGLTDDAMYRSGLSDDYERQANGLAGQILLPTRAVKEAYTKNKSLAALSELFQASHDAIRIRLRELRLNP